MQILVPLVCLLSGALARPDTRSPDIQALELRGIHLPAAPPPCMLECAAQASVNTTCDLADTACTCQDAAFNKAVGDCIKEACRPLESLNSLRIAAAQCHYPLHNRTGELIVVCWASVAISLVAVCIRLASRGFASHVAAAGRREALTPSRWLAASYGLDDLFLLLAFATAAAFWVNIAANIAPVGGFGKDVWQLTNDQVVANLMGSYVESTLYTVALTLLKLSFLLLFLRVFGPSGRCLTYCVMALHLTTGLTLIFVIAFRCLPIDHNWDLLGRVAINDGAVCLDANLTGWANAANAIVLDVLILMIPLLQIRKMNLRFWKKMALASMFCVGIFLTVVSIVRLHTLVVAFESPNPSYDDVDVTVWSSVELLTGIVCACMPAMRILVRDLAAAARPRAAAAATVLPASLADLAPATRTDTGGSSSQEEEKKKKKKGRGGSAVEVERAEEGLPAAGRERSRPASGDEESVIEERPPTSESTVRLGPGAAA